MTSKESTSEAKAAPAAAQAGRKDKRRLNGLRTRERITAAAETLFARQGYRTVGLRDIVREAGVNTAAIHYHFGAKEDLLIHVLRQQAMPIARRRIENLAKLRAKGPLALSELLDAFYRPAVFEERGGKAVRSLYADIRARLWLEDEDAVRKVQAEIFDESTELYIQALRECLPGVSEREVYVRFDFMRALMIHAMSNYGRIFDISKGAVDLADIDDVIKELVRFVEGGLRGPATDDDPERTGRLIGQQGSDRRR